MESERQQIDPSQIPGWCSDLAIEKRPGYPMWKRPFEGTGAHWENPPLQKVPFKEFHSIERPRQSAVVGTSVPPRGLSGVLRAYAYQFSEGSWGHWLPLILADRVNMIEGLVDDFLHGRVPNVYREMGGPAEKRFNPRGYRRKVAGVVLSGLALMGILSSLFRDSRRNPHGDE